MAKHHFDVVCGILCNVKDQVLVALRSADQDQGGLWEFPGGKVECNESFDGALCRELKEELGILVYKAIPWMKTYSEYQQYQVTLHVSKVIGYAGEPVGKEGQLLRWVDLSTLTALEFPVANDAIIEALSCVKYVF